MSEIEEMSFEIPNSTDIEKVDAIIHHYSCDKSLLISILQDTQSELGYLPRYALWHISTKLGIPFIQVFGVATFFRAFRLMPKGKHIIQVCMGTACHVRGAPRLLEDIQRRLNLNVLGTTADRMFTLETVNCLGCCALGPVVRVDDRYYGQMTPMKMANQLKQIAKNSKV